MRTTNTLLYTTLMLGLTIETFDGHPPHHPPHLEYHAPDVGRLVDHGALVSGSLAR